MKRFAVLVISFLCVFERSRCSDSNNTLFSVRKTGPKPPWNETYMDKLRKDLLTNYDKYARPGQHYDVTTVKIGLTMIYLDTDELNSTISVSSWFKLHWSDPKLKWNKDNYGGIDAIKMADHEVWQPDICLYNSALGSETVTRYGNPYVIAYSDGSVLWVPPSKFNAICEFDLYYWPFDTQHCSLKFTSWTHSGEQIKLELFDSGATEMEMNTAISAWDVNITATVYDGHYNCCPDSFYTAQFDLTLTRKSSSYITVVIVPILVIIGLILVQYSLPVDNGQKIVLNCCTTVMVTMLLTYFIQKVSHMGGDSPWIVSFYSTCLYLVCISMAESIFVLLILKVEQKQPLPWIIKKHIHGKLGKVLLLENCVSEHYTTIQRQTEEEMRDYHLSDHDNDVIVKSTSKSLNHQEWEILAVALDRILLLIYSFIFFVMILCYVI